MLRNKLHIYCDELIQVPAHLDYGKHMLQRLLHYKDKTAIINGETGESITYRQFAQNVVNIALSLVRLGVRKGDVVGICSEKNMEFMPTVLGILCAGATFSPVDITCGRATILHRLGLANPKVMFFSSSGYATHRETFQTVESLEHFIVYDDGPIDGAVLFKDFLTEQADAADFTTPVLKGADEFAVILYSSGTTGLPKGIPITHLSFLLWLDQMTDRVYYENKSILNTREWYYTYGLSYTLGCFNAGSTVVYCPQNDVPQFLEAIQKYQIQIMQLAPATLTALVKSSSLQNYNVNSLELIVSASTTCSAELIQSGKSKFPNLKRVCQLYGMSEAGGLATDQKAPKGPKNGSVGIAGPGFTFKVVDLQTRETLGVMQRGEICIKGPSLTPGYIRDTTFAHIDHEGFFMTGDVGYYDEDGYFFIVDRIKELIKFNSFQVAPAELEAVLEQHPQVREAGVVGAPHPEYYEAPTAFVVLQDSATITADELNKYVDTQVSYRMRLAGGIRIISKLPRGAGAKLDRKALKLLL